jgi:hypothetical protein
VPLGSYQSDNENGRFLIHALRGHGEAFGAVLEYVEGIIKVDASNIILERDAIAAN